MRLTRVRRWLKQAHKRFPADLFDGRRTLDIGCGRQKRPGSIGLDIRPHPGVDIVADLNGCLPIKDGQFDAVNADQVLEPVTDLPGLVPEIHRVLRPSGILVAHVPYFRSSWAHVDPTHVRSFTLRSMDYFVAGSAFSERYAFNEATFQAIDIFVDGNRTPSYLRGICAAVALARPDLF